MRGIDRIASETSATVSARLPAIDGLRGLPALVVVLGRATEPLDGAALLIPSNLAVCGFFVLSGYVLTRGWDASLPKFLSHWILMSAARSLWGPRRALLSVPLAFPLAWALWRAVEAPRFEASLALRRRGRAMTPALPARA